MLSLILLAAMTAPPAQSGQPILYRKLAVPQEFVISAGGAKFGGDLRIGDLTGDGRCDFLIYRCNHGAPSGAHMGGLDAFPGPEMVVRYNGHGTEVLVVSSHTGQVVGRLDLNFSPTNVGMEPVFWNGPQRPALLYNGGWLWNLESGQGSPLPDLPPANGNKVHRMGFHHAIPADVVGDGREELVVWDPTARHIFIYTPAPLDEAHPAAYRAGPRQYNPRLMD